MPDEEPQEICDTAFCQNLKADRRRYVAEFNEGHLKTRRSGPKMVLALPMRLVTAMRLETVMRLVTASGRRPRGGWRPRPMAQFGQQNCRWWAGAAARVPLHTQNPWNPSQIAG